MSRGKTRQPPLLVAAGVRMGELQINGAVQVSRMESAGFLLCRMNQQKYHGMKKDNTPNTLQTMLKKMVVTMMMMMMMMMMDDDVDVDVAVDVVKQHTLSLAG